MDRSRRDDPRYGVRRAVVYFAGLIAVNGVVVAVVRPGPTDVEKVAFGLMLAPTVGALAALWLALGGEIGWRAFLWPHRRVRCARRCMCSPTGRPIWPSVLAHGAW